MSESTARIPPSNNWAVALENSWRILHIESAEGMMRVDVRVIERTEVSKVNRSVVFACVAATLPSICIRSYERTDCSGQTMEPRELGHDLVIETTYIRLNSDEARTLVEDYGFVEVHE